MTTELLKVKKVGDTIYELYVLVDRTLDQVQLDLAELKEKQNV